MSNHNIILVYYADGSHQFADSRYRLRNRQNGAFGIRAEILESAINVPLNTYSDSTLVQHIHDSLLLENDGVEVVKEFSIKE